ERLLAGVKINRGALGPTLRFMLEPVPVVLAGEQDTICRITWHGERHHKADDHVKPPTDENKEAAKEAKVRIEQARALLFHLAKDGPVEIKSAREEATKAGLSSRALERAVAKLGWTVQYETGEGGTRRYFWTTPQTDGEVAE